MSIAPRPGSGGSLSNPLATTNQVVNESATWTTNAATATAEYAPTQTKGVGASNARDVVDVVATNKHRRRIYDAANALARTIESLAAAVVDTVVGTYELVAVSLLLRYTAARQLLGTRPSTDVRPPPSHEIVARATSLASGSTTAANKIGGHKVTELGRAQTEGTDAPGGWFIGLGNPVSNTIANGLVFGQGAAVGTPGDDAYRPFTTELGRIRGVGGYLLVTGDFGGISCTSAAKLEANAVTVQSYSGAVNLTAAGNIKSTTSGSGVVVVETPVGLQKWVAGNSTTDRVRLSWPSDVATTDATTTTLVTLTPSTTRPTLYLAFVQVENASGEAESWVELVHVRGQGACTIVGTTTLSNKSEAAVAACTLAWTTAGVTVLARGTGIAATSLNWSIFIIEVL